MPLNWYDETGMKHATEKQMAYARKIAAALGNEDVLNNFPDTMDDISSFISMFEKQYHEVVGKDVVEEPTEKQIKFAQLLYRSLNKDYPEIHNEMKACQTKFEYSSFISKWRPIWER